MSTPWHCRTCGVGAVGRSCATCGRQRPPGCGCAVFLLVVAVGLTMVAWFGISCDSRGPMCGGGWECLPDCSLDSDGETIAWLASLAVIWLGTIGIIAWPHRGRRDPRRQAVATGRSAGDPEGAATDLPAPGRVLIDGLVTCRSCGQRTAPGPECQWCDEPLGSGG